MITQRRDYQYGKPGYMITAAHENNVVRRWFPLNRAGQVASVRFCEEQRDSRNLKNWRKAARQHQMANVIA